MGFVPFLVLIVILVPLILFLSNWITVSVNRSTYCENLYVYGVDLNNYTREAGIEAVTNSLNEQFNTVYTLTYKDKSWNFSGADFHFTAEVDSLMERAWNIGHVGSLSEKRSAIRELKSTPYTFEESFQYDEALLDSFIDQIYEDVHIAPVDAEVTIAIDRPYLTTQSSPGYELDRDSTREKILGLIETGTGDTTLNVEVQEPAISTDEAAGGLEVIVNYQTDVSFRASDSRGNVDKALSYFNGMCIYPGDTIDFNEIVGPRSQALGWNEAPEYAGNTTKTGYGGGVCQASTTLYGAMLLSGMSIIDRSPHTMTVSYVDPSLDAAVSDNGKNLVFKNDTDYAIYIYTNVDREYATVTVYGNKPEYRYELFSNILSQESVSTRNSYINDEESRYCFYTDETKLYKTGRPACFSEGWLISYDWETGEEVNRKPLSRDSYVAGYNIYYRGVHERVGIITEY